MAKSAFILGQDQDSVNGGFAVNQDWEGIVDELLIFRRAFNSTQITSIYNNQIITQSNIAWHNNITVKSPNINGGALTTLSDATGDNQGEFSNNKVVVRCGNINNSAPCIVTYDVKVKS